MKQNLHTYHWKMGALASFMYMMLAGFSLKAYDFECDSLYYTLLTETTCEVTDSYSNIVNCVIPKTISYNGQSYQVTSIADQAFYKRTQMVSVEIPNSVTSIGAETFLGCYSLLSLKLPDSVISIGEMSFLKCTGLKGVTIPATVISINDNAFASCDLDSLVIEDSEEALSISNSAFSKTSLKRVYVGRNCNDLDLSSTKNTKFLCFGPKVSEISLFEGEQVIPKIKLYNPVPPSLIVLFSAEIYNKSIVYVPESSLEAYQTAEGWSGFQQFRTFSADELPTLEEPDVDDIVVQEPITIELDSLYYTLLTETTCEVTDSYSNIVNCNIPKTISYNGQSYQVTSIADQAFYMRKQMVSVEIPNSVTNIGKQAFGSCVELSYLKLPDSVESIGEMAFYKCYGLKTIEFSASFAHVGKSAFGLCTALSSVVLGETVARLDDAAFKSCSALERVDISNLAAWCNMEFAGKTSNPLYYANHLYLNGEEATDIIVPEECTQLKPYVFVGGTSLTSITIPPTIAEICDNAFDGCVLDSVSLSDSRNSILIANTAFENVKLKKVYIGRNTYEISLPDVEQLYLGPIVSDIAINVWNQPIAELWAYNGAVANFRVRLPKYN
jgi:hypothetical protein